MSHAPSRQRIRSLVATWPRRTLPRLRPAATILMALVLLAVPKPVPAFERVGAITLEDGEDDLFSAVIDPAGEFAYFGTDTFPGRVVKIDLETFERVDATITLESEEEILRSAVIDLGGEFAYFGTATSPGRVVKIGLQETEVFTPVALAADQEPLLTLSDGNAVFEPGERVLAAPAWRNDGMFSQLLSGTTSGFSGPAGPSYTLVDGNADYGTVEPQAISGCLDLEDCYAMEITPAGGPRPAPRATSASPTCRSTARSAPGSRSWRAAS